MHNRLIVCLIALLASIEILAQPHRITIPEDFSHNSAPLPDIPYLFFKDSSSETTIETLLNSGNPLDDPRWIASSPESLPELYSDDFYWFATQLYNNSELSKTLIFDFHHSRQELMDIYILREKRPMESYFVGNLRPYNERPIDYLYFAAPVNIDPGEEITLLIRTKNWPRYIVNLSQFLEPIQFAEIVSWRYGMDQLFIGILVAILLYSIALIVFMRDRYYVYFAMIVIQSIFVFLLYFGIAEKFFWPETPSLTLHAYSLSMVTFAAISVLFINDYCRLPISIPRARWLLYITCVVMIALFVISLVAEDINTYISLIALLSTIQMLLTFVLSLYMWRIGIQGARWIAIAWLTLCLGTAFLATVTSLNTGGDYHGVAVSQIIFVMILSAAVFNRVTELRTSEKVAQADSKAKSKFLAQMSHEIRNPMNGVIGMSQLLNQTNLSDQQKNYTNIIHSSASSLLTILNDILDFSKISAGKLRIEKVAFDLHKLANDCHKVFLHQVSSEQVQLKFNIDSDVPQFINSDPTRIRQIMVNFLSNALKFTNQGQVQLQISVHSKDPLQIKIAVIDTGIGLRKSEKATIFKSFQQADDSITRKYGGTGLGLAICKQLSELMGGDIGVESTPGKGSTFWATIAANEASAREVKSTDQIPISHQQGKTLRVLLAEDNEVNRLVARKFLQHLGHHCDEVKNGREAVNQFKHTIQHSGENYDFILMDVDMPELDGLSATREIRAIEKQHQISSIKIIALTAHLMPEYIEQFKQTGMDDHLSKPLQLWDLAKIIDQIMEARG